MPLAAGTRLGPYEILAPIGAGGMGEVYRAHDARLHRDVALKILPDVVSDDPERVARFEREARALAACNHPNIAQIFDITSAVVPPRASSTLALVMELVPGATLDVTIKTRGSLPPGEALAIARQIASALEAAHDLGIIHRDLKPANIKVRADGAVKVLDFGLAKALADDAGATADSDRSLTRLHSTTAAGVILGTAAYMAPEQAKAKVVDRRADIWSFGVVLFEMLTGRRLFHGEDASDTLAAVLKSDVDWARLPVETPPAIVRLLHRCLERDPQQRLRDIGDARFEIEDALTAPASAPPPGTLAGGSSVNSRADGGRARERRWWALGTAGAVVATAAVALWLRPAPARPAETRFQIVTPTAPDPFEATVLAVSPDGRSVVFPATVGNKSQLWIQSFDGDDARPLPGTENLLGRITWSLDGRTLLAASVNMEQQYDLATGVTAILGKQLAGFGGTWNADGVFLASPANTAALFKGRTAGVPDTATRLDPPQLSHRYPAFLPDNRHFLFLATGPAGVQGIFLGSLDSLTTRRLLDADTAAVFLPPDLVVFGREDTLFAQRLDMNTLEPQGDAFVVAGDVFQVRTVFGSVALAASRAASVLAYRRASVPTRRLIWLDRSGHEVGFVGDADKDEFVGPPSLSPDGRTIALSRRVNGNTDIWTVDNTTHGLLQRVTTNPAADLGPIWSPDGNRLAFFSSRRGGGMYDLFVKSMAGAAAETVLLQTPDNKAVTDWSRDGRFILYTLQGHEHVQRDIWALPLDGDHTPFPVSTDPSDELNGRFSPDGRWITYEAAEPNGGPAEVYVRPFPGPGRAWRISTKGGVDPQWSHNGQEIDYLNSDNQVMAASVVLSGTTGVDRGSAVALFSVHPGSTFAPSPDGQRFLVNAVLADAPTPPITVVLNLMDRRQ